MDLVQVMLADRFHEQMPYALVQRPLYDKIWAAALGGANSLFVDRRPFSEDGRRIEIDWEASVRHPISTCQMPAPNRRALSWYDWTKCSDLYGPQCRRKLESLSAIAKLVRFIAPPLTRQDLLDTKLGLVFLACKPE